MEYVVIITVGLGCVLILSFVGVFLYKDLREDIDSNRKMREGLEIEEIVHFVEEDLRDLLRYKG